MTESDSLTLLAARLGAENVKTDPESCRTASRSWSPVYTKTKMTGSPLLVDAVALPKDTEEVIAVVRWANEHHACLVPIGGGSNITGSSAGRDRSRSLIAVDLSRLQTIRWDEESLLVHVGAGYPLGALEDQLNAHAYTLGFLPQSLHLATVGGAAASNAVGLFSGRYGRQRDITAGLEVVLANGERLQTHSAPGGNASFDLHNLFIGSEGTLGIITDVSLRIRPVPEVRAWTAFSFPAFGDAVDSLRLIYRSDSRPAAIRLLDTEAAGNLLAPAAIPASSSLLLLAFEGDELAQTGPYQIAYAICQKIGGTPYPAEIGEKWFDEERSRTDWLAPNARPGGLADAFAVSAPWSAVKSVYAAVRTAISPLVTHLDIQISHAYPTGAALTFRFQAQAEPATPEEAVGLYERIGTAGFAAVGDAGGSMAHHYGVGDTHRSYFVRERGDGATAALRALKTAFDPNGVLPSPRFDIRREEAPAAVSNGCIMEKILLWPEGQTPGARGSSEQDIPTLTVYTPEARSNGAAVIVCPGGGYHTLAPHEGEPIALWLNSLGAAAFVLRYRHAPGYQHPTPLGDLQRAIRTVRSRAGEWNLDPHRIGILGFSAGGHLVSTAATHFDAGRPKATDPIEQTGSRPDVAIMIYPVITLDGRSMHLGSRQNLIGENPTPDLIESLSNQKQVTPETPPTFLVHSVDDKVVTVENSLEFALALSANGVPYAMQVYEHGGHGYGLGGTDPVLSAWPRECASWLRARGFFGPAQ